MSKNVNLSEPAYDLLNKFRTDGKSFSDVILEFIPAQTAGEVLDSLKEFEGKQLSDPALMKAVRDGRGRRSHRPVRRRK